MSEASDKLAASRRAIVEHVHRRKHRHEPHEEDPGGTPWSQEAGDAPPGAFASGWMGRIQRTVQTWWRHHPAHMALEVVTPVLSVYAREKPGHVVGVAAVAGAALMFARPWRLISITTIAVAVLKSAHLPSLLMSAMAAADFEKDHKRPE